MNKLIGLALTVSVGAAALPASAADASADTAYHNSKVAAAQARLAAAIVAHKGAAKVAPAAVAISNRAAIAAPMAAETPPAPQAVQSSSYPGYPNANPYRAYPPSCAADPLPDTPSGPSSEVYSTRMPLWTRDANGNHVSDETVKITIWRIACSSSGLTTPYNSTGQFYNAMTFFRIDRDAANEGHTDYYPTFPILQIKQGSVGYADNASVVRAAVEPNTVISDGPFDAPVFNSKTYVLENYPVGADYNHQYNDSFNLLVDPLINGVTPVEFAVNAYSPTQQTYPDAFNALPVDGYMATSYFDPAHDNEGMLINIYENRGTSTRSLFAAWYTFDDLGLPFWITANGPITPGTTLEVSAVANYVVNGGFAGNFGAHADVHPWGTMKFRFPDCGKLDFDFDGSADLVQGGPHGTGTRHWIRIGDENGMPCE